MLCVGRLGRHEELAVSQCYVCSTRPQKRGFVRPNDFQQYYLRSGAENAFLFFLKKKLLLNLKGSSAAHSWKNIGGKQKPISAVNVMLAGDCKIIIPL